VQHGVGKLLRRVTTLVQTSSRSNFAVGSYELPNSRDSNRDSFGIISALQLLLKIIQKKKNNVLTKNNLFGFELLTNIKLENPLSIAQNTIIAFSFNRRFVKISFYIFMINFLSSIPLYK
jgi:hypothetical protein